MGKQDKDQKKKQREEIKRQNAKIVYTKGKEESNFFKKLAFYLVGIVGISMIIQIYSQDQQSPSVYTEVNEKLDVSKAHRDVKRYTKEVVEEVTPEFEDTTIAKKIINHFEEWLKIDLDTTIHYENNISFNRGHLGIKNNHNYCKESDLYKLQHPESIYDNYYMLTDFAPNELPRQIAKDFGYDVMPHVYMGMNPSLNAQRLYDIPLKTALINSRISRFHHFHQFGECVICAFQSSNHIPGKWAITGKDLVIDNLRTYQKSPFKDPETCQKTITFMPPSYRLYDRKECTEFFNFLQTDEYKEIIQKHGIGFILKAGRDIHRGEGIELVIGDYERKLKKDYQNGKMCGRIRETLQVQRYIANPMLYKKRKIEVRIYFLIASVNPLIVYSQNLAHLRMCGVDFEKFSKQKEVHVCNVAIAKTGDNANFVVDFSLDGLRDYLIEEKVISNKNWVEEDVYPQIYRAITHLVRLGKHDFLKDSRVNENFALDFLLDDESKIWFMENNPNPQIMRISKKRVSRHYIMFGDMFEIQFKYLRSRFKRLQQIAREMKESIISGEFKKNAFRQKFLKANQNKLEPEFQIHSNNTYHKVYDETLEGVDQFCGNLPEACLYN